MSSADAKPLQYMRWSSSVEVPFWQALADQKLESMKLSEEPVPLGVTYEPARAVDNSATASMRFVVAPSALGAVVAQGPAGSAVAAPGQLFVFNRVETFKELNKSQLLAETAQGVWDDILSGAAAADPSCDSLYIIVMLYSWQQASRVPFFVAFLSALCLS